MTLQEKLFELNQEYILQGKNTIKDIVAIELLIQSKSNQYQFNQLELENQKTYFKRLYNTFNDKAYQEYKVKKKTS